MHWFAVLRKDGDDVAFAELVWQSADVDVGCVGVVCVPGRGVADPGFKFPLVEGGDGADAIHLFWQGGERVIICSPRSSSALPAVVDGFRFEFGAGSPS